MTDLKKLVLVLSLSLIAVSCNEFKSGVITGDFKTTEGAIETSTGKYIVNGKATVKFSRGILGLQNPKFTITQDSKEIVTFKIPRKAFSDNRLSVSAKKIGQPFSLKGEIKTVIIDDYEKSIDNASCIYSGYCYGLVHKNDGHGNIITAYEYGFNHNCNGHRWENRRYTISTQAFIARLIDPRTRDEIAQFKGQAEDTEKSFKVIDSGVCN